MSSDEDDEQNPQFLKKRHIRYMVRCLELLPSHASHSDSVRLSVAYFAISGLGLLNALSSIEQHRTSIIEWIYKLQIESKSERGGFLGSTNILLDESNVNLDSLKFITSHITMTYTGLASLLTVGDDLSRVNKPCIIAGLRALQQPDGSFCSSLTNQEKDMRFVYCAAAISYILDDWSGMDIEKTIDFIFQCISYDNGIGQNPGLESHGGSTYCAIATLSLINQLDRLGPRRLDGLRRWLIMRQISGFQGRPNKPEDTCYSFWIGASLKLLGILDKTDKRSNKAFIMSTQDAFIGGFSKWVDTIPDPMHTYLGIAGLSLINFSNLDYIHPALNITQTAFQHLETIHVKWRMEKSQVK